MLESKLNIDPNIQAIVNRVRQFCSQAKLTGTLKNCEVYNYEKEREVREKAQLLERCGIYARYQNCTFAVIESWGIPPVALKNYEVVKQYATNLDHHLRNGTGLILRGQVGTMKTTLAAAVLHTLIHSGRSGFFITMPSLLDTIFTMKERNIEEWLNFEKKVRETPLLILDDLGAEYANGWLLNKVDAIISERYNRCRPIIITTNLSSDQLRSTYAERLIDRMRSTCSIVTFSGQSMRPTANQAG